MNAGTLLLAGLTAVSVAGSAGAAIIGADDFSCSDGSIAGQTGGTGWNRNGTTASAWSVNTLGSGVVSNGQVTTTGEGIIRHYNPDRGAGAVQATGVVYFGVDMAFNEAATESGVFAGMSAFDFDEERVLFGKYWGTTSLALEVKGISNATIGGAIAAGQTYRVVGSIQWDTAGGQGKVKMWVDPDAADFDTALGSGALTSADAVVEYGSTGNWNTGVRLASGWDPAAVMFDNLIVATTFDEAAAIPEPAALSLLGLAALVLPMRRRR